MKHRAARRPRHLIAAFAVALLGSFLVAQATDRANAAPGDPTNVYFAVQPTGNMHFNSGDVVSLSIVCDTFTTADLPESQITGTYSPTMIYFGPFTVGEGEQCTSQLSSARLDDDYNPPETWTVGTNSSFSAGGGNEVHDNGDNIVWQTATYYAGDIFTRAQFSVNEDTAAEELDAIVVDVRLMCRSTDPDSGLDVVYDKVHSLSNNQQVYASEDPSDMFAESTLFLAETECKLSIEDDSQLVPYISGTEPNWVLRAWYEGGSSYTLPLDDYSAWPGFRHLSQTPTGDKELIELSLTNLYVPPPTPRPVVTMQRGAMTRTVTADSNVHEVTFDVTVTNTGTGEGFYRLDESFLYGAGLDITGGTVTADFADANIGSFSGGGTEATLVPSTGSTIGVGDTHVYTLTVTVAGQPVDAAAADCSTEDSTFTGHRSISELAFDGSLSPTVTSQEAEGCLAFDPFVEPVDPEPPVDPEEPTDPEVPVDPDEPVEPEAPTDPETPVVDEEPAEEPTVPGATLPVAETVVSDVPAERAAVTSDVMPGTGGPVMWAIVVGVVLTILGAVTVRASRRHIDD